MVIQIKSVAALGEMLSGRRHSELSGVLDIFCMSVSVLTTEKYVKISSVRNLKFVSLE